MSFLGDLEVEPWQAFNLLLSKATREVGCCADKL
jgi:hypothetical protein